MKICVLNVFKIKLIDFLKNINVFKIKLFDFLKNII